MSQHDRLSVSEAVFCGACTAGWFLVNQEELVQCACLAVAAGNRRRLGRVWSDARGRKRITLFPGHPFANSAGWQYFARFLVSVALDRALRRDEHIHHVNGDKTDDRPLNLEVVTPWYHGQLHAWAMTVAGWRDDLGRFVEMEPKGTPMPWPRFGPILGEAARHA